MSDRQDDQRPRRRRRQSPPDGRRPRQGDRPRKTKPSKKNIRFKVHVQTGLVDEIFFLHSPDWSRFQHIWIASEESIIIRTLREGSETDLILRGGDSARVTYCPMSPGSKIPEGQLITLQEMRVAFNNAAEKGNDKA